jgi:hypothetical protein
MVRRVQFVVMLLCLFSRFSPLLCFSCLTGRTHNLILRSSAGNVHVVGPASESESVPRMIF